MSFTRTLGRKLGKRWPHPPKDDDERDAVVSLNENGAPARAVCFESGILQTARLVRKALCTRPPKHRGDHVAVSLEHPREVVFRWRNSTRRDPSKCT